MAGLTRSMEADLAGMHRRCMHAGMHGLQQILTWLVLAHTLAPVLVPILFRLPCFSSALANNPPWLVLSPTSVESAFALCTIESIAPTLLPRLVFVFPPRRTSARTVARATTSPTATGSRYFPAPTSSPRSSSTSPSASSARQAQPTPACHPFCSLLSRISHPQL